MSGTVSKEAQSIIDEEVQVLNAVTESLRAQRLHYIERTKIESARARELTANLVATRRDDDKALLASDEAVSHALDAKNRITVKTIDKLIKRPYFGRIILQEAPNSGPIKTIEYKIGFAANPECRIIDWRKAPISKLFYEYKEGDEYSENIQGIERNGRIVLRNTVEIENSELKKVSCRFGTFKKENSDWISAGGSFSTAQASVSGQMPEVLALITAEQFSQITSEAKSTVLIQGIAGSGKTTVALHRLAWLLDAENGDLDGRQCLILVLTNSLRDYVRNTLPQLGLEEIPVKTIEEWYREQIVRLAPRYAESNGTLRRPDTIISTSIERVKRSIALLNILDERIKAGTGDIPYTDLVCELLSNAEAVVAHDETRLINRELVKEAERRSLENRDNSVLDYADEALIVRAAELISGGLHLPDGNFGHYQHIVVDEVQDLGASDLATIIGAARDPGSLTIVGDAGQRLESSGSFPGWDRLRKFWDEKDSVAQYFSLTVSHRSTAQIMKLAAYVQRSVAPSGGRQGRVPIWFSAPREPLGVRSAIQWLTTAMERFPASLTAVICKSDADARYALSLLRPTFGEVVRIGDSTSFSFDAGIIVSDIRHVKGLEFYNVLIWNPSEKSYPAGDPLSVNSLYIAITRAQENLCLVTWNAPASCLPNRSSDLVRAMQVTVDS